MAKKKKKILMTTGHIVLEDATRPLITVKIGYSMTIQQMILKKEKDMHSNENEP